MGTAVQRAQKETRLNPGGRKRNVLEESSPFKVQELAVRANGCSAETSGWEGPWQGEPEGLGGGAGGEGEARAPPTAVLLPEGQGRCPDSARPPIAGRGGGGVPWWRAEGGACAGRMVLVLSVADQGEVCAGPARLGEVGGRAVLARRTRGPIPPPSH